jgi:hypothetical protein
VEYTAFFFRQTDREKRLFSPLNAELNPICHLQALLGAHHIIHVSRERVKDAANCYDYVALVADKNNIRLQQWLR